MGTLSWGPYNSKDPTNLGCYIRATIFGNPHIETYRAVPRDSFFVRASDYGFSYIPELRGAGLSG